MLSFSAFATHERAGEITFKHIIGFRYEITVTTYTKGSSYPADRCTQTIIFGDGDSAIVCRSNFEPGDPTHDAWMLPTVDPCVGNPNCGTHHMGQWSIGAPSLYSLDIKKNEYTIVHTFPGCGAYIVSMTDPNRNDGIVNAKDGSPFSIQDTLKIFCMPGMPSYNNSVNLSNPPIDKACIGVIFVHNPGAVDPDGDSLSYKLGKCFQNTGTIVTNYFIPSGVTVNPYTGDLTWNAPVFLTPPAAFPPLPYEYNFAMDIEEWKLNVANGKRYLVSTVRRDMQVRVYDCDNKPPVIANVKDTCILANTNLSLTVTATDQQSNDVVLFTATGDPFNTNPAATFVSDVPPGLNTATGYFSWVPVCNQVRLQPYMVTLKALDDGAPDNVALSDYETFFIRVIAPAPKNLKAAPQCTEMLLSWDPALCDPVANPLFKYKIYRKLGCDDSIPGYCETGMPASWGYSLIATLSNATTSYTDNNGLVHGNMYSYRVVAYYLDGSESYVSDPVCNKLVRDVPIITNVDVVSTDQTNGSINVKWIKPIADTANYDTTQATNMGPYKFELLRATGSANPAQPAIATFSSLFFATLNTTSHLDVPLNTLATPYTYRIEFYSDTNHCPTQNASSIFLACNPSDNKIQISWNEEVPWTNNRYDVYRLNKASSLWDSIGTTTVQAFTDIALANGMQYCYKVKSTGAYPDTTLPQPLINWSQELCCSPVDMTPPCPNELAVDSSCGLSQNILTWTNPNNSCSDDALYYIIYHSDSTGADFYVVDTIPDIFVLTYLDDSLNSIAGCYAVTSVDSFGNEGAYSNLVCIDNCPYYELPNVFTPNGDGSNDHFTPLHPYKFVHSIDIKIYDRWGVEVFRTTDPEIMWNGISVQTNALCSDGVYYYACIVYDIRLEGIIPHVLTGNVHLLSKAQ